MVSRSTFLLPILFLIPTCLYAQSGCAGLSFNGTKEASLTSAAGATVLVRQPDGSFYGAVLDISTLQFGGLYSNYQNAVLTGCPATSTSALPSLPDNPPALGVASQSVALADFAHSGVPSVVFSTFGNPSTTVKVESLSGLSVNSTSYGTPGGAATVAAGDFNKDGNYDFVAVFVGGQSAQTPGGVQIFLGNGDGTFRAGATYSTGENALHVTVADLNNDGNLDLVVCGDGTSAISVLLGNGDGTFHPTAATPMAGQGPVTVIAADFNNDKKLDLGVSNEDGTVSIFLGNGDGSFQPAMSFPCGADCAFLAAGDFNSDGNLDLAVTNLDYNVLSVLLGKGNGTFGAPSFYACGSFPLALIVTDFNNDGKLDIVAGTGTPDYLGEDPQSGNVDVLLGNGDGTFQGTQLLPAGQGTRGVTTTDLNNDGKPDVVVVDEGSQDLTVFLGQGNGKFQALPAYDFSFNGSGGPLFVVAADFNGDGKMDVATVAQYAQSVLISLGNGDGTFQPPSVLAAGTTPAWAAAGDLNGDGKPDLVIADSGSQSSSGADLGGVLVFLSSGSGFQAVKKFAAGPYPTAVAIEDVNLDGKPDLVVSDAGQLFSSNSGGMSVLLGNGDGTFGTAASYSTGENEPAIASADVNGDGKPDIILPALDPNFNDEVLIFLGKGDGTFQAPTSLVASQAAANVIVADFNGDGKPDLLLGSSPSMSYFLGNGDGAFQPEALFNGGPNPAFAASADFNNDGKPDLAIANGQAEGGLAILLNTTPAPPVNMTADPGTTPQSTASLSGFPNALAVTVTGSSGQPVAGVSVTFTAPSSGASGTFAGGATTYTTSTNSTGVATAAAFTANGDAGSYTVSATAAGLSSVNFTLTNTAAAHPAFFAGEILLGGGIYYLQFPDGNLFGYYGYLSSSIFYHQDMGYEAFIPSTGGQIYLYDFASGHWWYTSSSLFPYLYDFTLNTYIYYFPNTSSAGHYTANPRYFVNLTTQKIFTM